MTIAPAHDRRRGGLVLVGGRADESLLFRELGELWFSSHRQIKDSTRLSYESQLRLQIGRFIGDRRIDELTVDDMAAYVLAMELHGYTPVTIRNAFTTATTVLDYAIRRGLLTVNPARLLPGRERPRVVRHPVRVLTPNQISALLAAATEPYRTTIAIAIFAGLRSGEIRGLQWADIDLENQRLHVRRQAQEGKLVPPKTPNAVRTVALLDPLPAILERYRDHQPQTGPGDLLFTDKGKPLRGPRLCYTLRRTAARAGIEQHPDEPPLRFHDLRHTAASIMIAARADVAFVARQLGHATPATTLLIYTHLFDEAANISRVRDYINGHFATLGGVRIDSRGLHEVCRCPTG
jgi:integrase